MLIAIFGRPSSLINDNQFRMDLTSRKILGAWLIYKILAATVTCQGKSVGHNRINNPANSKINANQINRQILSH